MVLPIYGLIVAAAYYLPGKQAYQPEVMAITIGVWIAPIFALAGAAIGAIIFALAGATIVNADVPLRLWPLVLGACGALYLVAAISWHSPFLAIPAAFAGFLSGAAAGYVAKP